MINVRCFTNIDKYRTAKWPDVFSIPPVIGHSVKDDRGRKLKIVDIIHPKVNKGRMVEYAPLEIELHN